jgi:hypothetical protein
VPKERATGWSTRIFSASHAGWNWQCDLLYSRTLEAVANFSHPEQWGITMPWDDFEAQKKKAQKILGDDAKFPDAKVDMDDLIAKMNTAYQGFDSARSDLENKLNDFENATDATGNGAKRVAATYESDDFGLDPKKKEDAKKIKQAQAIFAKFFGEEQGKFKHTDKTIDELQKHLIQLSKYKGPGK